MSLESTLYIVYSSTSIAISIVAAFLFWHRRNAAGAKAMALSMLSAMIWSLGDLLSALCTGINAKIFWDNTTYIGVVIIPVAWLVYSLQYTKNERYLTRKNLLLLSVIPVITTMLIWTNNFHHLFEKEVSISVAGSLSFTNPTYGTWFWIHAAYSYTLLLVGAFILIKKLVWMPRIYRNQSIIIIFAAVTPFIGSIFYTFDVLPVPGLDPTVFTFTFAGLLCFWGMFRFKLFDLIPAAREAVIESMDELIIVLDPQNRVVDINTSAKKVFGEKISDLIGLSVFDVLKNKSPQFMKYSDVPEANEKITLYYKNSVKCYDFRIAPLYDSN